MRAPVRVGLHIWAALTIAHGTWCIVFPFVPVAPLVGVWDLGAVVLVAAALRMLTA